LFNIGLSFHQSAAEQVGFPPIVDSKSYFSADYPLAPRGQRVRREPVNANLAGVAVAAQHRVAEISQPGMRPIMLISDLPGDDRRRFLTAKVGFAIRYAISYSEVNSSYNIGEMKG